MTREIKFRTWSNSFKAMLEVIKLDLDEDFSVGKDTDGVEYDQPHPIKKNVLMQFTGLLDQNGTEIFEGDVVEFWGGIGIIQFISGSFGISSFYELEEIIDPITSKMTILSNIHEASAEQRKEWGIE